MQLTNHEIEILRELAKEYAQIAALPEQAERRRLWEKLNGLQMERPMVLIDQIPWPELALADPFIYPQLPVSNPYWRQVESLMRQTIYKWKHMPIPHPRTVGHLAWPSCSLLFLLPLPKNLR